MAKNSQDTPQFGSAAGKGAGSPCANCEAMLADHLDAMLTPHKQAQFAAHLASCAGCEAMLADAQRGAAWLEMLRVPRPEPPAALLERILAQTAAIPVLSRGPEMTFGAAPVVVAGSVASRPRVLAFPTPTWRGVRWQPTYRAVAQTLLQPRLAMTAAMAFFSVGLTLNLTGVQLNKIRATDLKPSALRRNLYQANAHVVRYYDNLRVVYELESRVREIQRISDRDTPTVQEQPTAPDEAKPEKHPAPHSGAGTSRRRTEPARQSVAEWLDDRASGLLKGETV